MKGRKTWVKVKRGLITDPKHRLTLDTNIWLYLYMLDIADWETGKIVDWHDKAAADELEMPLNTIRYQRRKLEDRLYISCLQLPRRQEITIRNWVNPREYSGKVYNQGDNPLPPPDDYEFEGDNESHNESHNESTNGLTPLHIDHNPQTTGHLTTTTAKNVFAIYESEIGAITPFIVDDLKDLELTFPEDWIIDAIRVASRKNARNLPYIEAILKRWKAEGKDDGKKKQTRKSKVKASGDLEKSWGSVAQ